MKKHKGKNTFVIILAFIIQHLIKFFSLDRVGDDYMYIICLKLIFSLQIFLNLIRRADKLL